MKDKIIDAIYDHFGSDGLTKRHHCEKPAEDIWDMRYDIVKDVIIEFRDSYNLPSLAYDTDMGWFQEWLDEQEA